MLHVGELSALLTACLWTGSALSFAAATVRAGAVNVNVTRMLAALVLLALAVLVLGLPLAMTNGQAIFLVPDHVHRSGDLGPVQLRPAR
jgi:hypothetical protein